MPFVFLIVCLCVCARESLNYFVIGPTILPPNALATFVHSHSTGGTGCSGSVPKGLLLEKYLYDLVLPVTVMVDVIGDTLPEVVVYCIRIDALSHDKCQP